MSEPLDPDKPGVSLWPPYKHYYQGRTNGCGPAALSIALSRLGRASPMPEQMSRLLSPQRVPYILATPPWALHLLARKLGYRCDVTWRGSLEQVTRALEDGRSIIVLVRPLDFGGSPPWALHYRSVAGIETDQSGSTRIWLACSALGNRDKRNGGLPHPANLRLSVEDFLDQWSVWGAVRWMLELSAD